MSISVRNLPNTFQHITKLNLSITRPIIHKFCRDCIQFSPLIHVDKSVLDYP